MDLAPGAMVLHYRVLERLGAGGMGEVFKAEDTKLRRLVALKRMNDEIRGDTTARERFVQEARAASILSHPNLVAVHAIEEVDGATFIVMEYAPGEGLDAIVGRGPMATERVADVGAQIARALAAAHAGRVVHRDVKPSNVRIGPDGRARVLDFGVAKRVGGAVRADESTAALTGRGQLVGTLAYMAPELLHGAEADARSDLFALGALLHECATGERAFRGATGLAVAHAILHDEPPSVADPALDAVVRRALAKAPSDRYASAEEIAEDLEALLGPKGGERRPLAPIAGAPFVGREEAMRELGAILARPQGGVAFVTGEAGMGKTRVLDELARRAGYAAVILRGRCLEQHGTGEAYLPFLGALGDALGGPHRARLLHALRAHAPAWCLQLPAVITATGDREAIARDAVGATQERMLRELADALFAIAREAPVVVLLEDLQWADPASVDLVRHLATRVRAGRVVLVATLRPTHAETGPLRAAVLDAVAQGVAREIPLAPLGPASVAAYLRERLGEVPAGFAEAVSARTEGHPLFVAGLVDLVAARGVGEGPPALPSDVPDSVRSMIAAKIARLSDADRKRLQYASALGVELLSTIAAELVEEDEVDVEEALERCARVHRLVEPMGEVELPDGSLAVRYRFAHALYRDALYETLVPKRRALLHAKAGEALLRRYGAQAKGVAAELALHFERGRDFARAIDHRIVAGERAATMSANAEALAHYEAAYALVERLPEGVRDAAYARTEPKVGWALVALLRLPEAVAQCHRVLARAAGSPGREWSAHHLLAFMAVLMHDMTTAEAQLASALDAAARANAPVMRARCFGLRAYLFVYHGRLDEAVALAAEGAAIAEAAGAREALVLPRATTAMIDVWRSRYARALEVGVEARKIAVETADPLTLWGSALQNGMALGNLGRTSDALALLESRLELLARSGDRYWSGPLLNTCGWLYREAQDLERAEDCDRRALEHSRAMGYAEGIANALVNLGATLAARGRLDEARERLGEAQALGAVDDWLRWRYAIRLDATLADVCLRAGDFAGAAERARAVIEAATRYDAGKYVAEGGRLVAAAALGMGDAASAERAVAQARAVLAERPCATLAWRVEATGAAVRAALGDTEGARAAASRGVAALGALAEGIRDAALKKTLLASDVVAALAERAGR